MPPSMLDALRRTRPRHARPCRRGSGTAARTSHGQAQGVHQPRIEPTRRPQSKALDPARQHARLWSPGEVDSAVHYVVYRQGDPMAVYEKPNRWSFLATRIQTVGGPAAFSSSKSPARASNRSIGFGADTASRGILPQHVGRRRYISTTSRAYCSPANPESLPRTPGAS